MLNSKDVLIAIIVMAIITALLRFIPFLIFNGKKKPPVFIEYLGKNLPYAIMGMLIVYCLKNVSFRETSGYIPTVIGSVTTVGTYIWKRNTLLSILLGTISYMFVLQYFFK